MKKLVMLLAAVAVIALVSAPAAQAADGKALYDAKCAMCHGKDGVAKKMGEPARSFGSAEFSKTSTDEIVKTVTGGKNKMPAYKEKLKADEIKAVADYVKTLAPAK